MPPEKKLLQLKVALEGKPASYLDASAAPKAFALEPE
jgi:hypothetical protein